MKSKLSLLFLLVCSTCFSQLPQGFIYVDSLIPNLNVELRYSTSYNFVGKVIDGYGSHRLILTRQAAIALKQVQNELSKRGLSLKIYDGYRPQRAVNQFMVWAKDLNDTINKSIFYPHVAKKDLFREDYIAARSGHSRGSTVDLTVIDIKKQTPLDMGSPYDFFGHQSWVDYQGITAQQKANRQLLQTVMKKYGFKNYPKEWWHFTLRNEPFPNTYFDFPIK